MSSRNIYAGIGSDWWLFSIGIKRDHPDYEFLDIISLFSKYLHSSVVSLLCLDDFQSLPPLADVIILPVPIKLWPTCRNWLTWISKIMSSSQRGLLEVGCISLVAERYLTGKMFGFVEFHPMAGSHKSGLLRRQWPFEKYIFHMTESDKRNPELRTCPGLKSRILWRLMRTNTIW